MNVTAVEPKGDKAGIILTDDGQRIWTPEKAKADELVGKPIPSDWTIKQGDYGPQAFPPRDKKGFGGGGAAAFRNTKDGQAAEQRSIHASVALQHAIARYPNADDEQLKAKVSFLFAILQELSSGGSAVSTPSQSSPQPTPPTSTASNEGGGGRAQNRARAEGGSVPPPGTQGKLGEGEPGSPGGVCAHPDNSPLKPDGSALPNGFSRCLACGVVHK